MTNELDSEKISITCQDGYRLTGSIYKPANQLKGAIIMGPATGIKRQFYSHFAHFLAQHGYGVITFDNRGIGQSINGKLRQSDASLQCWGEQDLPAVLVALQQHFPNSQYHLIGHSAGGQLVGLMHNAQQLSSMYNIASSSGQLKNMKIYWK